MQVHNNLIPTETGQKLLQQVIDDLESKLAMYRNLTAAQTDQDTKDAMQAWQTMSAVLHYMLR